MVARYSEEYIKTIRERMRNDMRISVGSVAEGEQLESILDALVEDGMHPLEKIVADITDEDMILGRCK